MTTLLIFADAPDTPSWPDPDNGSLLENLLLLGGVPLLVFILLALAVYLPSMIRGQSGDPALAFQERSEWFGGPRKGVAAAPEAPEDGPGRGGASARW